MNGNNGSDTFAGDKTMTAIPAPRLCHISLCPDTGYGFSLIAKASRPGRYVASVEEGSTAEAAGLIEGDRIVEVNGVNVNQENHKQMDNRIKLLPHETKLLLIKIVINTMLREILF